MMTGAASGGIVAATGIAGLAALGIGRFINSAERVRSSAKTNALSVLTENPEFKQVNPDRLMTILKEDVAPLSQTDLIEACKSATDNNYGAALARRVYATLPISDDDEATKNCIYLVLEAGMNACVANESFHSRLQSVLLPFIAQSVSSTNDTVNNLRGTVDSIQQMLMEQTKGEARKLRLTDELFIELANRYSDGPGDIEDIDQARKQLERALKKAHEIQVRNALPPNPVNAVDFILEQVSEINATGKIDEAAEYLDKEAVHLKQGLIRVIDARIDQSILTRDVKAICDNEFRKLELLTPKPSDQFVAFLDVQNSWYTRGDTLGLNFDLEVAIELGRVRLAQSQHPLQRATVLCVLGCALQVLGSRDSDPGRLRRAIAHHREALDIFRQHQQMNDWAMVQNNLGNAYSSLGTREKGIDSFKVAVASYRLALPFRSRDRNEYEWAMTQNNLGAALRNIAERSESDDVIDNFISAESALRSALEVRTLERNRVEWAMTQGNIGCVLCNLGYLTNDTQKFEEAERLQQEILDQFVHEDEPLLWATAQHNIGITLRQWGEKEKSTDKLSRANLAFTAALEERAWERTPLDWAKTQDNLAMTELAYSDSATIADTHDHLTKALFHVNEALDVYDQQTTPLNHRQAIALREEIKKRLAAHRARTITP